MRPETLLIQPEFDEREAWYALARERGFGVELVSLAFPKIINQAGVSRRHVDAYRAELAGFGGAVTMHGPFVDVIPHSSDRLVAAAARTRVHDCLGWAAEIGATHVVFHTGINHAVTARGYFDRAAALQAEFWRDALERFPGVTVCLENMWEPGPDTLRRIVDGAAHPRLGVCLDVGHAHVYGRGAPPEAWIEELGEHVAYLHLNDNHGDRDAELPLGRGAIAWEPVFRAVAALPAEPLVTVEVATLDEVRESLRFLADAGEL